MNNRIHTNFCPCGSSRLYEECCKGFHQGNLIADTPESLLRSRFSAFFMKDLEYVFKTSASKNQSDNLRRSLEEIAKVTRWLSLVILERFPQADKNKEPRIRYAAFLEREGKPFQIHELSFFTFEQNHLRYDRGEFLKAHSLGRNEPCWCGNGKKLKHCHEFTPLSP